MARFGHEFTFDLVSYARPAPGRRDHLTSTQKQYIARIVGRTPEVMIKVLAHGASDAGAVRRHLDYIGRRGDVELETDDGRSLQGQAETRALMDEWDLELDTLRERADLTVRSPNQAPRLVHKLMFSMPPGTSPEKVLKAVQSFCREEFAIRHRYAMALHTDEPHPHVHVVLKAVSEEGRRLNIRKATLRSWREGFAHHLRALGVPASATPRYVRGEVSPRKLDAIFRPNERGESVHMRERILSAQNLDRGGDRNAHSGKAKLLNTRGVVSRAWAEVSKMLEGDRENQLAFRVKRFVSEMPTPLTELEWLARRLSTRESSVHRRDGPTR